MTRREFLALRDRIIELQGSDVTVNSIIAEYLGWTNIQYDAFAEAFRGHNPNTGDRSLIPDFTGSVDVALTTIPDKWVESYQRRFDNTVKAHCRPRGDLELEECQPAESSHLAVAFCAVGMTAHAMMQPE